MHIADIKYIAYCMLQNRLVHHMQYKFSFTVSGPSLIILVKIIR